MNHDGTLTICVLLNVPGRVGHDDSMSSVEKALRRPFVEAKVKVIEMKCTEEEATQIVAKFRKSNGGNIDAQWHGPRTL